MARTMHRATIALPKRLDFCRVFQTSIRSHIMPAVGIISVAWLGLAGCIYIPPAVLGDDGGIDPAGFEIGSTSRSDVLSVLADPLVDEGRFILDELETSDGAFLIIVQFGIMGIPVGVQRTRLLLEFNEANILQRLDVETASQVDIYGGVAPDERPLQELQPLGKLLRFNDVSWLTGPPIFRAAAFSPKGNLLAAIDLGDRIFLIDFVSQTIERISPEGFDPDGHINSVTFSPDSNSLAVQSRTIRIIDLKSRKQTVLYDGHGNASIWDYRGAIAMAYAPSGEVIASGGTGGNVKIWETSSGREIASWFAHEEGARAIAFSTDGAMLATAGGDGFVRLWDRKTGAELGAVNRRGKPVFSDDGKLLAIASGIHAELWRLGRDSSGTSQGRKFTLYGPMDMIILPYIYFPPDRRLGPTFVGFWTDSTSFTPGGRRLLHSARSTVIWDWTERRKTPLAIPIGDAFLAFSPDGRTMATSSLDGVRLWKLPGVSRFEDHR